MSVEDSFRDEFREEARKLRTLPFGQKLIYIWDYYKIHLIVLGVFIALIVFMIRSYIDGSKIDVLYGISVNNTVNEEGTTFLTDGFLEDQELSLKEYVFNYDYSLFLFATMDKQKEEGGSYSGGGEFDYTTTIKIMTTVAAGDLDYMLCNGLTFDYYADGGLFADLEEVLPSDMWEQVKDSVVYFQPTGENADRHDRYACGINLSTLTDYPERFEMDADPVYLGIVSNSQKQDTMITYLQYLLDNNGK